MRSEVSEFGRRKEIPVGYFTSKGRLVWMVSCNGSLNVGVHSPIHTANSLH